jgi:hypothetical protein
MDEPVHRKPPEIELLLAQDQQAAEQIEIGTLTAWSRLSAWSLSVTFCTAGGCHCWLMIAASGQ